MRKTIDGVIVELAGVEVHLEIKVDMPKGEDFEVIGIHHEHEELNGLMWLYDVSHEFKVEVDDAVREALTNELRQPRF